MNQKIQDTIYALATAQGISAIALIRVSGSNSFIILDKIFSKKNTYKEKSHTIHFGKIVDQENIEIDEVLLSIFKSPNTYTGEDTFEISCHGSTLIIKNICHLLTIHGARQADPGEFTLRAFLNNKLDLSQAEAVADLIHSESKLAHQFAMNQLKGGIKQEMANLRDQLVEFASLIELELDFAEEDVNFADRSKLNSLLEVMQSHIRELQNSFQLGNAVQSGIITVIAGRPNAGKSSLLNAILADERAIVSDIAGTTRDTIEEAHIIKGIKFKLIDTAGIREAKDQIEQIGISRTLDKIKQSSILLYVVDITETNPEEVQLDLSKLMHENQKVLLIANKMDQHPYYDYTKLKNEFVGQENIISCSAKNKMNIEYIKERLFQLATGNQNIQDNSIAINARHMEALTLAANSIEKIQQGIKTQIQSDFLAQEIRQTLYYLGLITGEITNDEILGSIFSKFCIGK